MHEDSLTAAPTKQAAADDAQAELDLLRTTVESLMDAVVVTSPELDAPGPLIEYVNPAFCRMTGYTAEEVIGRSPRMLQGPATDRRVLDRLREDLAERGVFSGQAVNYRKDGSTYLMEWLIAPVRDARGRVARWVAVQRDVSERQQMRARQLVLLSEVQRRVRDVLGAVRTVARETGHGAVSVEDYWAHLDGRVDAMARTQAMLCGASVELEDILLEEMHAQGVASDRYRLDGPAAPLGRRTAEVVAMVAHELATNAIKFGALSPNGGRLEVRWRVEAAPAGARRLHLEWCETGVGEYAAPAGSPGYGFALISQHAPEALGGQASLAFAPGGVRCMLEFALDRDDDAADARGGIDLHALAGALDPGRK